MSNYAVISPIDNSLIAEYPVATDSEIEGALASAAKAYSTWARTTTTTERSTLLRRASELWVERAEELGKISHREMGKPLASAVGEAAFAGSIVGTYADKAAEWLADEELDVADGLRTIVRREGIGVVLGIMPWNYPFYQVARFVAPNLALGNTVILKHANQCPESALAIEKLFRDAGFPDGAYTNTFASHDQIASIIADDRVQGISLTGSERAGAIVAEQAGRHLKRCVLELGGSDPFIVLDTADIDYAVAQAVAGRLDNNGQSCNGSKRIIVLDTVYDEFEPKFLETMRRKSLDSDPLLLSSKSATRALSAQVQTAVDQGATLAVGDIAPRGNVFTPSVLTGVTPEMDVYSEELFGPVAQLYKVSSDEEAIALANDTPYGLGSVIICDDIPRAEYVGRQIETGMVFIGSTGLEGADVPFGGTKRSGYGRELGKGGLDEFANKKLYRFAERNGQ